MTDPFDATTTAPARLTIDELAHQAVTDPTKLDPAQVTRLGDWILDHEAHVLAHNRLLANVGSGTATRDLVAERRAARAADLAKPNGELVRRIEPMKPDTPLDQPTAMEPVDTTEHTT